MSTDTEKGVDIPPSPFPDPLVYLWLSVLEGVVAFGLVLFSIGLLEGGEIIPDVLPEWYFSPAIFVVVSVGMFALRLYRGGYIGS